MDVAQYDALVLIHPAYGEPKNPQYVSNLTRRIKYFQQLCKPVFLLPSYDAAGMPTGRKEVHDICSGLSQIPGSFNNYQQQVDFISHSLGKNPEDIVLAFGGTYAEACVQQFASAWCVSVENDYRAPDYPGEKPQERPFKFGKVLSDIV